MVTDACTIEWMVGSALSAIYQMHIVGCTVHCALCIVHILLTHPFPVGNICIPMLYIVTTCAHKSSFVFVSEIGSQVQQELIRPLVWTRMEMVRTFWLAIGNSIEKH